MSLTLHSHSCYVLTQTCPYIYGLNAKAVKDRRNNLKPMNGLSNRSGTDERSSYDQPLNRVVKINEKSGGCYFKGLSTLVSKIGRCKKQIDHIFIGALAAKGGK